MQLRLYFFLLLSFCVSIVGQTQSLITLSEQDTIFLAGSSTSVLADASAKLTIEDIIKRTDFLPNKNEHILFGKDDVNSNWVKFELKNQFLEHLYLEVIIPFNDTITLYTIVNDSVVAVKKSGMRMPNDRTDLASTNTIFDLKQSDKPVKYYLNIQARWFGTAKLRISTYKSLFKFTQNHSLFIGLMLGFILMFVFYNIIVFFQLKDSVYLFYSLYLFFGSGYLLFQYGLIKDWLFQIYPHYNDYVMLMPGLSSFFGAIFSINFLETKQLLPKFHKLFLVTLAAYVFYCLFVLMGYPDWSVILVYFIAPYGTTLIFVTSIVLWSRGNKSAKYYMSGWVLLTIGLTLYLLENAGLLPFNAITAYAMPVSWCLEAITLSLAIAHRFKTMKTETQRVQEESFIVLKQNEELINEKNRMLEKTVIEKTTQLQTTQNLYNLSEEMLQDYAIRLEKSNKELTEFAHIASHDLKAPLRSIISFSQLFERRNKAKFDDVDREYFDFIKSNANRSARMIEDVLNYSKIDKNLGEAQTVILSKCIFHVENNLTALIQEKKAEIIVGELPILRGHISLFTLLFQNFISNGIKYNTNPSPTVHVDCFKDEKGQLVFSVKDNGIGISPADQRDIFTMFRRLHSQAEYEGTGIGLAFCTRIVETYSGKIWLESVKNEGTTFFFTVPKAEMVLLESTHLAENMAHV